MKKKIKNSFREWERLPFLRNSYYPRLPFYWSKSDLKLYIFKVYYFIKDLTLNLKFLKFDLKFYIFKIYCVDYFIKERLLLQYKVNIEI